MATYDEKALKTQLAMYVEYISLAPIVVLLYVTVKESTK